MRSVRTRGFGKNITGLDVRARAAPPKVISTPSTFAGSKAIRSPTNALAASQGVFAAAACLAAHAAREGEPPDKENCEGPTIGALSPCCTPSPLLDLNDDRSWSVDRAISVTPLKAPPNTPVPDWTDCV